MFNAKEAVFSNARSTYIYSDFSYQTAEQMLQIAVFQDNTENDSEKSREKFLHQMLRGCFESG